MGRCRGGKEEGEVIQFGGHQLHFMPCGQQLSPAALHQETVLGEKGNPEGEGKRRLGQRGGSRKRDSRKGDR